MKSISQYPVQGLKTREERARSAWCLLKNGILRRDNQSKKVCLVSVYCGNSYISHIVLVWKIINSRTNDVQWLTVQNLLVYMVQEIIYYIFEIGKSKSMTELCRTACVDHAHDDMHMHAR